MHFSQYNVDECYEKLKEGYHDLDGGFNSNPPTLSESRSTPVSQDPYLAYPHNYDGQRAKSPVTDYYSPGDS